MKKITALILCIAMVLGFIPQSFAAKSTAKVEELARDLKALGLFKGVSETDFALDRAPTRTEALVMLIRVLGKENEALQKGGKHPFLDVPEWADKYVGYAYENKLTNGISATKFGAGDVAYSSQYLTFVLRALGYSDANGQDFTWDNPYMLARTSGILLGNPDTIDFSRGDVVLVSYAALEAQIKGTEQTLAEKLMASGAFTAAEYDKYYDIHAFEKLNNTYEMSSQEIYEECSPAVFLIDVYDEKGQMFALGSGFFISSDGTAVTNYHVIEGASAAKIKCTNGRTYDVLGVYDYNKSRDWAVIKVDGKDFPYLEIEEAPVKGGVEIYTIGNPQGHENTISEGLVSNPDRVINGVSQIQISAPISPGSSGGALLNKYGKVVGITSGGFTDGQNLNLAIPISYVTGYDSTRAFPFSALIEGDSGEIFGHIDLSQYPESERAYELLRMWLYMAKNKTMEWGPGYIEVQELDGGGQMQFILSFDEGSNNFDIGYYEYGEGDSYEFAVEMSFGKRNLVELGFMYFEEEAYDEWGFEIPEGVYDWGLDTIQKTDVCDGFNISFNEYDGDYFREGDWEETLPDIYLNMLEMVETIFRTDLRAYEVDGVRALGFTKCYFD